MFDVIDLFWCSVSGWVINEHENIFTFGVGYELVHCDFPNQPWWGSGWNISCT